jgi:DNA-binding NarL/FixJ family response regulator
MEGLKLILSDHKDSNFTLDLVGEASDARSFMATLKNHSITQDYVMLMDLNLPDQDGVSLIQTVKKTYPVSKVLAITMYDEPKVVKSAFKAGADGYLLKSSGRAELMKGLREVINGNTYLDVNLKLNQEKDLSNYSSTQGDEYFEDKFVRKYQVTKRELEILKLITKARSNKDIAKELYISDQTVSVHRKNIMRKLSVSSTASLIRLAYEHNVM